MLTFANSLDPDQAQNTSDPIRTKTVGHSDGSLERFFSKKFNSVSNSRRLKACQPCRQIVKRTEPKALLDSGTATTGLPVLFWFTTVEAPLDSGTATTGLPVL